MKKILPIFCLLVITTKGFSQQFSQYNTGTLFDSFENPSQRTFIPDSSRKFAFNFFIPNFDANFLLQGNAQSVLVNRKFGSNYTGAGLQIGNGNYNNAGANETAYALMAKIFASFNGDEEIGIFAGIKSEGTGAFTDETVALFEAPSAFTNNTYDNILNDHFYNQIYNAVGLTYREKLSSQFAIGFKVSFLMGIDYTKLNVDESHLSFNNAADETDISLRGKYYVSKNPGKFDGRSFLPNSRNPGAQISIGTSYQTDDNITLQANIKDLGFIHWYSGSFTSNFDNTTAVTGLAGLSPKQREQTLYNSVYSLVAGTPTYGSFTSATDGRFEFIANKSYYLNSDNSIKYLPTFIVSKELFYSGYTAAMVNRFQFDNMNVSLTPSYDNLHLFNLGLQLMYKSSNMEVFIGSDRLIQTAGLASAKSNPEAYSNGPYTGGDIFFGFAIKLGPVIEHPLNASTMPTGDKGFIARLWNRMFKTYQ
jgi:hypothetical protein